MGLQDIVFVNTSASKPWCFPWKVLKTVLGFDHNNSVRISLQCYNYPSLVASDIHGYLYCSFWQFRHSMLFVLLFRVIGSSIVIRWTSMLPRVQFWAICVCPVHADWRLYIGFCPPLNWVIRDIALTIVESTNKPTIKNMYCYFFTVLLLCHFRNSQLAVIFLCHFRNSQLAVIFLCHFRPSIDTISIIPFSLQFWLI